MNQYDRTRIYVKIVFQEANIRALAKCVYYKDAMTVNFFYRWKWFFDYRAALLRVKHPKAYIEITSGPYQYTPPEEEVAKLIADKIRGKKAMITKVENRINQAKQEWNELFPIEENMHYQKALFKLETLNKELQELI